MGLVHSAACQTVRDEELGDDRIAAAMLLFFAMPAIAQTVVDAGTVYIGCTKMRFWGIDVPDASQTCDGGAWHPHKEATTALQAFVAGKKLDCSQVSINHDENIPEVLCFVIREGGRRDDVQAFMVESGWAWAVRPGTLRYVDVERWQLS